MCRTRIPATLCGVGGLKPTHGLLSIDGVINASRSMDNIGPLTRSVADAEFVMDSILGRADDTTEINVDLPAILGPVMIAI